VSFAGCGFLSLYLVGAAACLQKHSPNLLERVSLCGASAGSLVAACLACNVPLETLKQSVLSTAVDAQLWSMGPFSPSFNIEDYLREGLSHLPPDAHRIAQDRLFVSLTRKRDMRNVVVSSWASREELIQSLLCSCFIPVFSGIKTPTFRGEAYIDGGFTDNLPIASTPNLSISPFAGGSSICPKDHYKNPAHLRLGNHVVDATPANLVRLIRSILPPPIEDLHALYKQGFSQADSFLKKSSNNYIKRTQS
ncbi:UNVERIFIED_CONTAM: hypothetical protein GTU68_057149, partial [Idotea baltica]|nr:hypothetical protein [Idotea baltica]